MKKAFTLIESVLYLGLFTMFIGVVSVLFVTILDAQLSSSENSLVTQDGRYIQMKMAYDIGRATSILMPVAPGESGGQLQLVVDGQENTYSIVANRLQLVNNQGTNFLNGNQTQVSNFLVTRLGNGVKDSTKVSFIVTTGEETEDFNVTTTLR